MAQQSECQTRTLQPVFFQGREFLRITIRASSARDRTRVLASIGLWSKIGMQKDVVRIDSGSVGQSGSWAQMGMIGATQWWIWNIVTVREAGG